MKLCIASIHDIRSKDPHRPTPRSLVLGILQTGMGLRSAKENFSKVLRLYTAKKLIKS